jgi:hypothetical protein
MAWLWPPCWLSREARYPPVHFRPCFWKCIFPDWAAEAVAATARLAGAMANPRARRNPRKSRASRTQPLLLRRRRPPTKPLPRPRHRPRIGRHRRKPFRNTRPSNHQIRSRPIPSLRRHRRRERNGPPSPRPLFAKADGRPSRSPHRQKRPLLRPRRSFQPTRQDPASAVKGPDRAKDWEPAAAREAPRARGAVRDAARRGRDRASTATHGLGTVTVRAL